MQAVRWPTFLPEEPYSRGAIEKSWDGIHIGSRPSRIMTFSKGGVSKRVRTVAERILGAKRVSGNLIFPAHRTRLANSFGTNC